MVIDDGYISGYIESSLLKASNDLNDSENIQYHTLIKLKSTSMLTSTISHTFHTYMKKSPN